MAYMSQEHKKELSPAIKAICKKYGVKATISVNHHSTLELNIKASAIDFIESYNRIMSARHDNHWDFVPVENHIGVNVYHYQRQFDGKALAFLTEVIPTMMTGNHNNSDIMTDYFDIGWYIDIHIGQWDKPYILLEK